MEFDTNVFFILFFRGKWTCVRARPCAAHSWTVPGVTSQSGWRARHLFQGSRCRHVGQRGRQGNQLGGRPPSGIGVEADCRAVINDTSCKLGTLAFYFHIGNWMMQPRLSYDCDGRAKKPTNPSPSPCPAKQLFFRLSRYLLQCRQQPLPSNSLPSLALPRLWNGARQPVTRPRFGHRIMGSLVFTGSWRVTACGQSRWSGFCLDRGVPLRAGDRFISIKGTCDGKNGSMTYSYNVHARIVVVGECRVINHHTATPAKRNSVVSSFCSDPSLEVVAVVTASPAAGYTRLKCRKSRQQEHVPFFFFFSLSSCAAWTVASAFNVLHDRSRRLWCHATGT